MSVESEVMHNPKEQHEAVNRIGLMYLLKQTVQLQVTLLLCVAVIVFIAAGEAYRVAPELVLKNICNQSHILRQQINQSLSLGMPIEYKGFAPQVHTFALQTQGVERAEIKPIYAQADTQNSGLIPLSCSAAPGQLVEQIDIDILGLVLPKAASQQYVLQLPLATNTADVGVLSIALTAGIFNQEIHQAFGKIIDSIPWVFIIFTFFVAGLFQKQAKASTLKWAFYCVFSLLTVQLVMTSFSLYQTKIIGQSDAVLDLLSQRLSTVTDMGFDLDHQVRGVDELLEPYRVNNSILHSLNVSKLDEASGPDNKEGVITNCRQIGLSDYQVCSEVLSNDIYQKLWKAVRNIFILLAALLLILNVLVEAVVSSQRSSKVSKSALPSSYRAIRAIFVLGVLLESITLSFFPAYLRQTLALDSGELQLIFSLYFLGFACVMVPAAVWVRRFGVQTMLRLALVVNSLSLLVLAYFVEAELLAIARLLSGMSQGLLVICVQSQFLRIAQSHPQFSASNQLLIGFYIGAIAGVSVGAVVVPILGVSGVFMSAAVIGGLTFLYSLNQSIELAVDTSGDDDAKPSASKGLLTDLLMMFKDRQLQQCLLLIAIPIKAIHTGVILIYIPVLINQQFADPNIAGQIIALYFFAILIATHLAKPNANNQLRAISLSVLGTGLSIMLIASFEWVAHTLSHYGSLQSYQELLSVSVIVIAVLMVGFFQGTLGSPLVGVMLSSHYAKQFGSDITAANYRFLERMGAVLGPMLTAVILVQDSNGKVNTNLSLVGCIFVAMGFVFYIFMRLTCQKDK